MRPETGSWGLGIKSQNPGFQLLTSNFSLHVCTTRGRINFATRPVQPV